MKKIIATAVMLIAAVVLIMNLKIETPAEHDKRLEAEKGNVVIILSPEATEHQGATTPSDTAHAPTPAEKTEENNSQSGDSEPKTEENTNTSGNKTPDNNENNTQSGNNDTQTPEGSITPVTTTPESDTTPESGDKPLTGVIAEPSKSVSPYVTKPGEDAWAGGATPVPTAVVTKKPAPTVIPSATPVQDKELTPTEKPVSTATLTPEASSYVNISFKISAEEVKDDGLIFSGELKVKSGATVLEVLDGVCKASGIKYTNLSTGYGAYISSIGGVSEKEYGTYSGWKYLVNGKALPYSCDRAVVSEGDIVEWIYVTKY